MSLKPWEFENPPCAEVGHQLYYMLDRYPDLEEEEPDLDINSYKKAISICKTCPYQEPCASWGIKNEVYGIWGGITPKERRQIRRRQGVILPRSLDKR